MSRTKGSVVAFCVLAVALTAGPSTATFSGKNGRISFSRDMGNHRAIFTANPDGSHIQQLTARVPRLAMSFESDWSPDGRLIAFDSDRTDRKYSVQIYVVAANGGEVLSLIHI